ncbi:MAG TPA: DUF47 family protein [Solirubrobacteraceae bacterium]|jgi:uncharacterized protein Yka (UPF0111/DUF47 family)
MPWPLRSTDRELVTLVERAGANIVRAGLLLRELMLELPERSSILDQLKAYEQESDRITHDIIHRLAVHGKHRQRPFDASDGYALAGALDDVLDNTEQAAAQLHLYKVEAPMEQALEFADVLVGAGEQIVKALERLCSGEEPGPQLVEIHRLENEGDRLLRDGVASLFAGGVDPMVVIRWKDIFQSLEEAVDACETVAHVIEGIMLKRGRKRSV